MRIMAVLLLLSAGCFNYEHLSSGLGIPLPDGDIVVADGGTAEDGPGLPAGDLAQHPVDLTPPPPLLDDCSDKINGTPCGPTTCYTGTTVPKIDEYICFSGGCLNRSRYCYDSVITSGNFSACCPGATAGNDFCQPKMSTACD